MLEGYGKDMKTFRFFAMACLAFLSLNIAAQSEEEAAIQRIKELVIAPLQADRSDLQFTEIKKSPLVGYYEFSIENRQTIYVSADAEHFFAGELYFSEPDRFVNATEIARSEERKQQLAAIPESEMIIYAPEGETKAVMNVFTDVTCGYCRKLHEQMTEMNALGIEVRYFAYPRTGIRRDGEYTASYAETSKAWCAEDQNKAMDELKGGERVSLESCDDNPLEKHYEIGQKFGISGTPAIVLPDGSLHPGYRSPENYAALLGIATE